MDATTQKGLLKTKQHYELLDGMRGVAAISVVVFHFMEIMIADYSQNFIAHAYLAVDFFFCLSGFVIAYAYDAKLASIGKAAFVKLRLIRLHPLVVIGSVWGLIAFLLDPYSPLFHAYAGRLAWMFVASCFMIPFPVVKERYFNLFHLNPPTWSLFWEYIANLVYAWVLVRLNKAMLWVLLVVAAVLLFVASVQAGNLSIGWSGDNFWGGGARVFFSFTAGLLVYRSRYILRSRLGFLPLAVLLTLTFLVPYADKTNPWADPLIVIVCFPLLVSLGAGGTLRPGLQGICRFFGKISYPLYMIHYPFLWWFFSYVQKYKPSLAAMTRIMIVGTICLIGLAWLVLTFVDEPVRKRLRRKLNF